MNGTWEDERGGGPCTRVIGQRWKDLPKPEKDALIEKAQAEQQRLIAEGGVPQVTVPSVARLKKSKAGALGPDGMPLPKKKRGRPPTPRRGGASWARFDPWLERRLVSKRLHGCIYNSVAQTAFQIQLACHYPQERLRHAGEQRRVRRRARGPSRDWERRRESVTRAPTRGRDGLRRTRQLSAPRRRGAHG